MERCFEMAKQGSGFKWVILFLMVASLVFVAALSKQSLLIKQLVQEFSILKAEQKDEDEQSS